jgi:periplasmic protein TonB
MFEDATFHSRGILPSQTPKWMLLAFAVNLTLLSALVILPLIYPQGLPVQLLQRALYVPAPPHAAQPQPRVVQPVSAQSSVFRNLLAAPPVIPTLISTTPDAPPPSTDMNMPSAFGAVPGATDTAATLFHRDPPPVVHQAQPQKITISGGVTQGLLLYKTTPAYPIIAKTAGISGTIALAATISKTGAIANLRVLSGPPMLRQAAIDAVQNWRYRPYLLNNQPVEVETTINVVFSLANR